MTPRGIHADLRSKGGKSQDRITRQIWWPCHEYGKSSHSFRQPNLRELYMLKSFPLPINISTRCKRRAVHASFDAYNVEVSSKNGGFENLRRFREPEANKVVD